MNDYRTMPNPALQPSKRQQPRQPIQLRTVPNAAPTHRANIVGPIPRAPNPQQRRSPKGKKRKVPVWLMLLPVGLLLMVLVAIASGIIVLHLNFANKILPRVYVAGIPLGNMTQDEAVQVLNRQWSTIVLSDGTSTWDAEPTTLGITLNAVASAEAAFAQGYGEGGWTALFNDVDIAPVISIDPSSMNTQLTTLAPIIEIAPINAGVEFVDGVVFATEPQYGTMIDVQATIHSLQNNPEMLADGVLEMTMLSVAPQVLDSSELVTQAESLLSSPLDIRVFDPVTGDSVYWSVLGNEWGNWITATSDPNSPIGLALSADEQQVRNYLQAQANNQFDSSRYLELDEAVASVQRALARGTPQNAFVRVHHSNRSHIVQSGESLTSIAWDYGIPYLYIMQANGGIESVSVGQEIIIPPADFFIEGDVNPNKRIVVSISAQRTYVYENDTLIYEWASSTGISSSPTWTGIYQILSHEPNAYAANWDLYMPNFMGVYQPVPGSEFTNGFHGFPTRGGGQLLWENSLGTRVTYGCILLSDTHVQILYEWAEEGVIVEIQP